MNVRCKTCHHGPKNMTKVHSTPSCASRKCHTETNLCENEASFDHGANDRRHFLAEISLLEDLGALFALERLEMFE